MLLTDEEITSRKDGNLIRNGLKAVFPEADSNSTSKVVVIITSQLGQSGLNKSKVSFNNKKL